MRAATILTTYNRILRTVKVIAQRATIIHRLLLYPRQMRTKLFSLLLSVIISFLALYYAFRKVPVEELIAYLSSINYLWVFPAVILIIVAFVIRAQRWKVILEDRLHLNFWQAYHPLMIAFMINLILPGRIGEIVRPALLKKRENLPFSIGLASVIAERLFDLIMLLLLFITITYFVTIDPDLDIPFGKYHLNKATLISLQNGMVKLCLFLIFGILLIIVSTTRKLIIKILEQIPSIFFFFSESVNRKIKELIHSLLIKTIDNIASGFSFIKQPRRVGICLGLTLIIWGLHAFSYYILALGCPSINLSIFELSAVMVIVCFFIALPSVPGFWGLWEAGGVFALSLFSISNKDAAGYTLTNHFIQIMPIIIAGCLSAILYGVNILPFSRDTLKMK